MNKVRSLSVDYRLKSFCANMTSNYRWYLDATSGAEDNLKIQRKIISGSRSYATLRSDLVRGCVLPSIVIAINSNEIAIDFDRLASDETLADDGIILRNVCSVITFIAPRDVYIIDGLQRTNALRQVAASLTHGELEEFLDRPLRLEVWVNIPFSALAYRMLLLNAGQRPMSVKLQVEILSQGLKVDLQTVDGIEIIDFGRRRNRPGQFQLSKLSLAFQAWLTGNPNVEVRNIVVEQMLADSALETLSASMSSELSTNSEDRFRSLVAWLVSMDRSVGESRLEFFGNETVLQGIAAAVGSAQKNSQIGSRVKECLQRLETDIEFFGEPHSLAIDVFDAVRKGIDPSKKNVGEASRNLVFYAFQEYFFTGGTRPMAECWQFAGARA